MRGGSAAAREPEASGWAASTAAGCGRRSWVRWRIGGRAWRGGGSRGRTTAREPEAGSWVASMAAGC